MTDTPTTQPPPPLPGSPPPRIYVAAPKHTGGKGHRYVRFPDGSLRRTDKVLRKALVGLPFDQQTALVQAAMDKLEAEKGAV